MGRRVFFRFLRLYFCLLLALIVLYIPFYYTNLSLITEKSMKQCEITLSGGLEQLEYELNQVRSLSNVLGSDTALTLSGRAALPLRGNDVYKAYSAQKQYAHLISTLPEGMTAFYCLPNGIVMASQSMYYSREEMYRLVYDNEFKTHTQWFSWFNGFSGPTCLFPERRVTVLGRSYPALIYSIRVPIRSNSTEQMLFVILASDHVHDLLSLSELYPDTILTLASQQQGVLYRSALCDDPSAYTSVQVESASGSGLTVSLLIPSRTFASQLNQFKYIYAMFIGLYLVIGVFFSVFLAYRSSRPITRILASVKGFAPERAGKTSLKNANAYQYLNDYIRSTQNRFNNYEDIMASMSAQLCGYSFQHLLKTADITPAELANAQQLFPDFPVDYRLINIHMEYETPPSLERNSSCQVMLLSVVSKELPGAVTQWVGNSLVLTVDANLPSAEIDVRLLRVRGATDDADIMRLRIAISRVMHGMYTLHQAYQQTRNLLRASTSPIIHADDLPADRQFSPSLLLQNGDRFYNAILATDDERVSEIVKSTVEYVQTGSTVVDSYMAILFHIFLVQLLRLRSEMAHTGVADHPLPEYSTAADIHALMQPIEEYAHWAIQVIGAYREQEQSHLSQRVIQYIDNHLSDPELCLPYASTYLDMTESEVKRIIFKAAGRSFFDYIDSKRMSLAKELLLTTDISISDLIQQCGYHSLNTFYKAFKRTYGVSPTQMRQTQGE